jgi:hypothetical protein
VRDNQKCQGAIFRADAAAVVARAREDNAEAPFSAPPLPLLSSHEQGKIDDAKAPLLLPSHPPLLSTLLRKQGAINGAEVPSLLPFCMPLPLSSPHEQGTANNAEAPLSVPLLPLSLSLHEQGAIDCVEAPSPLPSRAPQSAPQHHQFFSRFIYIGSPNLDDCRF